MGRICDGLPAIRARSSNLASSFCWPGVIGARSRVSAAVKTVCSADGVSIRQNNGKHGDQDVFHVHFHVVPRFAGDGFIGLDHTLGMVDVSMEERIEQARKLSDELRRLSST